VYFFFFKYLKFIVIFISFRFYFLKIYLNFVKIAPIQYNLSNYSLCKDLLKINNFISHLNDLIIMMIIKKDCGFNFAIIFLLQNNLSNSSLC